MLSAVVAPLIEKALGKWIKLEPGKLDVSGGKVRLTRVELREDAWNELALPVSLRGGMIEEVEVDIPWTKLKTDSVVVRLHQPVLLLAPQGESEWDSAAEAKRSATRKKHEMHKLVEGSAPVSADAASAPIDDGGGANFLDKLIARAIENAQVLVTSAVIRYEDYSHAASPFAIEVAFDSLWIHPEHIHAPEPGSGSSGAAHAAGHSDARPSSAHREALVCALCQRHERFEQYRAVFARNVEVDETSAWRPSDDVKMEGVEGENSACDERYREVTCETCRTVVGVMDEDEVYHFFNVFASAG